MLLILCGEGYTRPPTHASNWCMSIEGTSSPVSSTNHSDNMAVIFDVDGVMLDSEQLYLEMNQALFRELGARLDLDRHRSFIGISATTMWTYIKESNDLPHDVEQLKAMERDRKYVLLRDTDLQPSSGLIGLMELLQTRGIPMGVASSGLGPNVHLILEKLGVRRYLNAVISGEMVERGKPHPDIFLLAAKELGERPSMCTVIEDSTNGVIAAKAAGMRCIGYANPTSGDQDLCDADVVVTTLADVYLHL